MQTESTPLLLSLPEAGRRLGVGRSTIYELMRSGELASRKVGRRRMVPAVAVERFAAEATTEYVA